MKAATTAAESSSPRNTSSDEPATRTPKPKKKLNRQPASCSGCRQRRTRCDRGRPCSECDKRKTTCDYTGASAPPSIPPVSLFGQVEREEYIKQLEARLEALEKSSTSPTKDSSASSTAPAQDFSLDDLAAQLSIITIGKRVCAPTSDSEPHALRTQLESIMASQSNLPHITFIKPEQQFSLDLVAKYLVPSLEELCSEHLPSRPQVDILAQCYFNTVNLWSPNINTLDWNSQLDAFWNLTDRLNFRPTPTPSDPPHLTRHYLAQFIAILYAVMGHGLSTLADIHHLESTADNQSSVGSSTSSPPRDDHLWSLSQAEKISLANRWFRFSLGLLMSPVGNIYVKPTIFGIRAMSILSNVEHAPENLDHGIFFWSLTSNLAVSVGLFREPPIADDEDIEILDETEIESRRELAWSVLALDWAGYVVANGKRPVNDVDQISVKYPGTVISRTVEIHPADGWPTNPLVCVRKLAAQMDHLMRKVDAKVLSGHPVTYEDLAETVKRLDQLELSLPPRLQMRLSADGKSLETVVESAHNVPVAFLHARFCVLRMRLHRLFIFPKAVVPPEERLKQLRMLLTVSKQHFLAVQHYPHHLSMHPLMIYGLINTAVPCALVLLINHQTHELEIEEDFFLAQLHKTTALFDLGKKTMAATMARKAITLLKTIIQQIELRSRSAGSKNWDRRKKGPAVALEINQNAESTDGSDEVTKRKQPKVHAQPQEPANFPFQQEEFGMPSAEPPQAMQHNRQRSGHPAMHSISSSDSIISTSQVMIPTHASLSIASHPLASSTAEAFSVQPTPPLVPSQPSQRPGFSTHSSSSQFSPILHNTSLDRLNSGPSTRPVANLPRSHYLGSTVEFGAVNTQLDNHQFDFRVLQSLSQGYGERGAHTHAGTETGGAYNTTGPTNRLDSLEFLLPHSSGLPMESASSQSADNLAPFQPTFNLDFGLTDAVVSTAGLADLAHPPGFFVFAPVPETRSATDEGGPHEINSASRVGFSRRGSHQPPQQTAHIVTTTAPTTDHPLHSHAHYHHPYFGSRYRPSQNPHD